MGLRLPPNLQRIGRLSELSGSIFPPPGFAAFDDHALGNGDSFGLYWPIGQEAREPLVIETMHDDWSLAPRFSSLDRFLEAAARAEGEPVDTPDIAQDPDSPHACVIEAKETDTGAALTLLNRAIARLPEYTAALAALAMLHRRLQDHAEACRTALRAVRSPPSFGDRNSSERVWRWLSQQQEGPEDLRNDPIWTMRARLAEPPRGGKKENDVYRVLREAMDAYIALDDTVAALCLMQSYAEYMFRETVSFQERHVFLPAAHDTRRRALEARLADGPRTLS